MEKMEDVIQKVNKSISSNEKFVSFHIDYFYKLSNSAPDFLCKSAEVFNRFVENVKLKDNYTIHLDIELKSENSILKGVPKKIDDLLEIIDLDSMPEIMVSEKVFYEAGKSEMEYYLSPLPFTFYNINTNAKLMYSEYKKNEESTYTCWLSLIYG